MTTPFPRPDHALATPQPTRIFQAGDVRCTVLIGSQRRQTSLLAASADRFVIAGWQGLALGARVHLVIERGRMLVQECLVVGATSLGVELACIGDDRAPPPALPCAA
jgi:hypothetical protein